MPNHELHWLAPAKVNLSLKILGKRSDGFHDLESLMVPLDLADRLIFTSSEHYSLCCDTSGVPVDETNLVTKAVRLFQDRSGKECRWKVSLEKEVPHGAGLGGGSSDAATALLALNELEGSGLAPDALAEMGAEIGSDVPFFIYQQACLIGGRGEIVTPVDRPELSGQKILLLKPAFGVDTPDAYNRWKGASPLPGVGYAPQQLPWGEIVNDLELPVFEKFRFLAEMKVWLLEQAEVDAAMMSGSGSTMMAFLSSGQAGSLLDRARKCLDPTLWSAMVTIR
ncbi:4-(cytidine 5'-diphospho)-2-C-methyl-D-erythritol kinase [Verrucomicrobiaceae bacterium N1E253]|uniref:4-diphosphocytidyl-2-C-methyl-D-erythritol kinase n=1 Tax=Oceaniferula marina TaxID=2748318 RepID=A0A851GAG0_9BACT|nr:4-(cytidine 5'-diphospho)-2-C-methyl-D-erythritol kinase [Oceaniferula marina]NWK54386.1 4-(cytidine 5'-diphospho)-2-C-methyl-D-erythritol kinase [Oceaniferula marina]